MTCTIKNAKNTKWTKINIYAQGYYNFANKRESISA